MPERPVTILPDGRGLPFPKLSGEYTKAAPIGRRVPTTEGPMIHILLLAAATQPVASPAPVMGYATPDNTRYVANLRRQCMSEKGITLVLEMNKELEERRQANQARNFERSRELAEAVYSKPFDAARTERAFRARGTADDIYLRAHNEATIALLKALPPSDGAIYARQLTGWIPTEQLKKCDAKGSVITPGN